MKDRDGLDGPELWPVGRSPAMLESGSRYKGWRTTGAADASLTFGPTEDGYSVVGELGEGVAPVADCGGACEAGWADEELDGAETTVFGRRLSW